MIPVKPSVQLALALSAAHVVAVALVWLAGIPVPGKAVATLAAGASLVYFMARYATLHDPRAVVALECRDTGEIGLRYRRGDWAECALLGSTFVSAALTIVRVRPQGGWRARQIVLVADNVDPEAFRRLRVWLRWKATGDAGASQGADG